jgi:hypothetical protein
MKDDKNNNPFSGWGSPKDNKKFYWTFIVIFALVEIGLGISIFFK